MLYFCAKIKKKKTTMQKLLCLLCAALMLGACRSDEEEEGDGLLNRTVLVYISGENTLSSFIDKEFQEMRVGSRGIGNNALVVYVDDCNSERPPYIMRIVEGQTTDSVAMESDQLASDPEVMGRVLSYTAEHFAAHEYGLVLWGHASGWLLEDSVAWARPMKGYGIDNGRNAYSDTGKWLNMNSLARILRNWGHPLRFIMADCCQFQCIESAYELRNQVDYIIGAPSEIPGVGAPYDTMTPRMFDTTENFYEGIVDAYYAQTASGYKVPLSAIRTSELDALAEATGRALKTFAVPADECPDLYGLIYYKGRANDRKRDVMYDMNDFMLHYAPEAEYQAWKPVFDRAVPYRKMASNWMSNAGYDIRQVDFMSFEMTEERFGGVSMFVPQNRNTSLYNKYNADIKQTAWYWAVGMQEIGW